MKEDKHIQDLIEQFDFDALSPAQREWVLSEMDQDEYTRMRSQLTAASVVFQSDAQPISPDPETLVRLREAHAAHKSPSTSLALLLAMFEFRVPAYQAGLAAVLLFFFGYFFWSQPTDPIENKVVVTETVHDTIELINEVMVEVPVERIVTQVVYRDRISQQFDFMPAPQNVGGIVGATAVPELASIQQSFGNSSFDQNTLEQFKVSNL